MARVLVVVAIHAQQLPVAAVRRVAVVVVVAMVHGQLLQIGAGELARAAPAEPRIHLQRALAIALVALFGIAPRLGDDAVELVVALRGFTGRHCLFRRVQIAAATLSQTCRAPRRGQPARCIGPLTRSPARPSPARAADTATVAAAALFRRRCRDRAPAHPDGADRPFRNLRPNLPPFAISLVTGRRCAQAGLPVRRSKSERGIGVQYGSTAASIPASGMQEETRGTSI